MLVSSNKEWIQKAKFYATQAKEDYLHYEHTEVGYNYRMSNILAAVGVAQMEVLSQRVAKKQEIFEWYKNELSSEVEFMPELKNSVGNRWLTTVLFKDRDINHIIKKLEENNCESRPLWKPMHMQPLFSSSKSVLNGVSEDLYSRGLCLPSGTTMSLNDLKRVCRVIKNA